MHGNNIGEIFHDFKRLSMARHTSNVHRRILPGDRDRYPAETMESLGRMLGDTGIRLDPDRLRLLWRYHELIRLHNDNNDLTRLRNFRDFVVKHYIDCLIVPSLVTLPSPLLDIGTGAGFPGIPLKIGVPGLHVILSEGRSKRVEFLQLAVRELALEGIEIFGRGILPGRLGRKVGGVITRALESASDTLGRISDILDPGGLVILMKGPKGTEEVNEAIERHGDDFFLKTKISYTLADTSHLRTLLVFEKKAPPIDKPLKEKSAFMRDTQITSPDNPSYKTWKSLLSGRGIRKHGLALVSGSKIAREVCELKPELVKAWIGRLGDTPTENLPDRVRRYIISGELFRELDMNGTNSPMLLTDIPPSRPLEELNNGEGPVLLVPFQDPSNVGAVMRTAVAFGVRSVVLLRESAVPFHPKGIRAGGTTLFMADLFEGPSIHEICGRLDIPVVALSTEGEAIGSFRFPTRFALLPGVEGPGLPGGIQPHHMVQIPMEPGVESLNAATAAAIVLYEWKRRVTGSLGG